MVNAAKFWPCLATLNVLLLGALVLASATCLRGAEYDEQYTLFLTAGTPRPIWPEVPFPAGTVAAVQSGHATLTSIAYDLRATDVHPPFYFWALSIWRQILGPSLIAARAMSVLCGLISLALVGVIARSCAIRPGIAMLLTLGCYGFVYTNTIARGFASAQMLTLGGICLLLRRRPLLAGVCLGAACCCNYLAVFVAAASVFAAGAWSAMLSAAPFLVLDAWFFAAQHASRPDQFPPFELWQSLTKLAQYQVGSVFGGLPLYLSGAGRVALAAGISLAFIVIIGRIALARPWNAGPKIRLLLLAAVAPPAGLLLLGVVFDNTPVELRYLSFGLPFIALLVAWASGVIRMPRLLAVTLAVQSAAILGLLLAPRTMQPYRAAAIEASGLIGDGIVLLPAGNDGVGIVGAFGIEAPATTPILLVHPDDSIAAGVSGYRRVVIALLPRDRDSTATIKLLRATFTAPFWRPVAIRSNVEAYERTGKGD